MNRISIGQLRQNPTEMIRAVRKGATYTLTDRGEPVAEIAPYRDGPRWRTAEESNDVLRDLGSDETWFRDDERMRAESVLTDPWSRA